MKGIRITSKKDGFRRAGVAHHGTVDHALDAFTKGQLAALRAEPNLIVVDIDPPDDKKAV